MEPMTEADAARGLKTEKALEDLATEGQSMGTAEEITRLRIDLTTRTAIAKRLARGPLTGDHPNGIDVAGILKEVEQVYLDLKTVQLRLERLERLLDTSEVVVSTSDTADKEGAEA